MKILVSTFAYNEGIKIKKTLSRFPINRNYDILVVNDGSTDGSIEDLKEFNVKIINNGRNMGIGYSIKTMLKYALSNRYEIAVIMAGNDKDNPDEITRLIEPIINEGYDFVQGSRYLEGGSFGNMPFYRKIATKYIHPFLFLIFTGKKITDSSNGFRAIKLELLKDQQINIEQDWLNKYELETYILYKIIKLSYKIKEVPVTKIYPPKELGYTKVKPFTGWWSILRPLFFLALGLKK
jgi:dolichol-phosphate mannosyltransferase